MKLEEVKLKIDAYIDKVPAEELLHTLTKKYGMQEYEMSDIENIPDEHLVGCAEIA